MSTIKRSRGKLAPTVLGWSCRAPQGYVRVQINRKPVPRV